MPRIHQPGRGADGTGDGSIGSWSAHHCPTGTPVRYVLCRDDAQSPIRLVLGSADQVQLDLSLAVAGLVIKYLTGAVDEIAERPVGDDTGPAPAVFPAARPSTAPSGAASTAGGQCGGIGDE